MTAQSSTSLSIESRLRSHLIGLECWYASFGGKHLGSTFSLAFGDKVRRKAPLNNPSHSEDFRNFEGSVNILVWCSWRIDGQGAPESSSDDTEENIANSLNRLVGAKVTDITVERPGWDLRLLLLPYRTLKVFCDHVPGDPTFDGNWELHTVQESYYFGPGCSLEVSTR